MVATKEAAAKVSGSNDSLGTGRRKTSVARVRIRAGQGHVLINDRKLEDYFPSLQDRNHVLVALEKAGKTKDVDVIIRVNGGGVSGQSGACMLGVARALKKFDTQTEEVLRQNHLLTRDSRMKERKHYGLRRRTSGYPVLETLRPPLADGVVFYRARALCERGPFSCSIRSDSAWQHWR